MLLQKFADLSALPFEPETVSVAAQYLFGHPFPTEMNPKTQVGLGVRIFIFIILCVIFFHHFVFC
jgi:hypothetical protein